jgi:hypothetical protein
VLNYTLKYRGNFIVTSAPRFTIIMARLESLVSEVAFPGQRIWSFVGNRLVEAHVHRKEQVTETKLMGIGISFAVIP